MEGDAFAAPTLAECRARRTSGKKKRDTSAYEFFTRDGTVERQEEFCTKRPSAQQGTTVDERLACLMREPLLGGRVGAGFEGKALVAFGDELQKKRSAMLLRKARRASTLRRWWRRVLSP